MHEIKEPGMPIIRFEIQGMRDTLLHAICDRQLKFDEYIAGAIDSYCDPDNLAKIMRQHVQCELNTAIRESIEGFFRYGEGRKVVREAVIKRLQEEVAYLEKLENPSQKEKAENILEEPS